MDPTNEGEIWDFLSVLQKSIQHSSLRDFPVLPLLRAV